MYREIGEAERRGAVFEEEVEAVLDDHAAAVPPSTLLRIVYDPAVLGGSLHADGPDRLRDLQPGSDGVPPAFFENGKSVVFAGGTGSGKPTSLNAISYFVPPGHKTVSIEDTPELRLPHQNWVRNVTRESSVAGGQGDVTTFDLLGSALRQRLPLGGRDPDDGAGGNGSADGGGSGGTGGGTTTSADSVTGVEGSVDSRNIRGSDRGREASFAITTPESATTTGVSVTTQNGLEGRPFVDRDTTFGGGTLPATFSGELEIALRDIDASRDLGIFEFVAPADAGIVVTLEFDDGSTRTVGLG